MSFDIKHEQVIGHKVWKNPKTTTKTSPCPFKSGFQINTVKAVVTSPYTGNEAFTFEEDDSIVDCKICSFAPKRQD